MEQRNLDLGVPLTREQWEQLGQAANARPDFGIFRWAPLADWHVIHLSMRADEAPPGWADVLPANGRVVSVEREVAQLVYNDGRPFARVVPPTAPAFPAIPARREQDMQIELERWVRAHWRELLRESGLHYDRGALPAIEPSPPV